METISLENGKYIFRHDPKTARLDCLRFNQPWRDFVGDKAVGALFGFAQALSQNIQSRVEPPGFKWVKNNPDEHQWFADGSVFFVALQVQITRCEGDPGPLTKWEYATVQIDCDGDHFQMWHAHTDKPYDDWDWEDFEYFALLEGEMPTRKPKELHETQ